MITLNQKSVFENSPQSGLSPNLSANVDTKACRLYKYINRKQCIAVKQRTKRDKAERRYKRKMADKPNKAQLSVREQKQTMQDCTYTLYIL